MKLGFVTYQIGHAWDIPTIIEMCNSTGFTGVELRTTHAHGVETSLTSSQREAVREQFHAGGVDIAGLGSAFEYHVNDAAELRRNIDGTIQYCKLAADLGCPGVKVRPNGFQTDEGIPEAQTLEQIGKAVGECAAAAADLGVEIRVEVHGRGTQEPRHMRTIMDHADHSNAYVCWNSNFGEVIDGSIDANFELLKHKIGLVHITEICKSEYPWRDLFSKLSAHGYDGYTLAEIPASSEPERLMGYYRALWEAYQ
ncbi:MAG: TIM barrel protein [Candidatus Latescibacteria bacterium]|jgi:sugar phosphate isomerase/epimerase|nr:TIM barrel protein [Candidatus Latescibacterota bacterium]